MVIRFIATLPRDGSTYAASDVPALIGLLCGQDPARKDFYPRLVAEGDTIATASLRRGLAERAAIEMQGWLLFDCLVAGSLDLSGWSPIDEFALLAPRSIEHMTCLPEDWSIEHEPVPLVLCRHHARPIADVDPPKGLVHWVDPRSDSMLLRSLESLGWLRVQPIVDPPF